MKTKKSSFTIAIIAFALLALQSCMARGPKGNKNIVSREYTVTDYNKIDLVGSCDMSYEQKDGDPYVRVEIDSNLQDLVEVTVDKKVLKIKLKNNADPSSFRIYTNSKELGGVDLLGSGNIYLKGTVTGDDLNLVLSGSGNIRTTNVQLHNLTLKVLGSGDVDLAGKSQTIDLVLSGSGNVKAAELEAKKANCKISGSGNIKVNVEDSLEAKVSGSGNILYKGTPSLKISVSGSGQVRAI